MIYSTILIYSTDDYSRCNKFFSDATQQCSKRATGCLQITDPEEPVTILYICCYQTNSSTPEKREFQPFPMSDWGDGDVHSCSQNEHLSLVRGLQSSSCCWRTLNTVEWDGKYIYFDAVRMEELFCRVWTFYFFNLCFIFYWDTFCIKLNGQLHKFGHAASRSSPTVTGVSLCINISMFKARPSQQLLE